MDGNTRASWWGVIIQLVIMLAVVFAAFYTVREEAAITRERVTALDNRIDKLEFEHVARLKALEDRIGVAAVLEERIAAMQTTLAEVKVDVKALRKGR